MKCLAQNYMRNVKFFSSDLNLKPINIDKNYDKNNKKKIKNK